MGKMTKEARCDLIAAVYLAVYEATESFEQDDIGMHLAYLLGAIATGKQVDFGPDCDANALIDTLRDKFPVEHPVWSFIPED